MFSSRKRAALLTHGPLSVIGGMERFTIYLLEFLREQGFHVHVYEPSVFDSRIGRLFQPLAQYCCVGREVGRDIENYALVITLGFTSGFLKGRNVVNISFGSVRSYSNSIKHLYNRKFLLRMYMNIILDKLSKKGKLCVAASSQVQAELKKDYGTASVLVPCGIDIRHFSKRVSRHELRLRYGIEPEATVGMFCGRWDRAHKGLDSLLPIMQERGDVHWLIATNCDPGLEGVRNLTVLRNVGYEELPSVYSAADFTVQLSRYESFGFSFVESLACSVPVISTPVGIANYLYDDSLLSQLLVPYPADQLEHIRRDVHVKIERLKDKPYLEALAARGRARVEEEFGLELWKERMGNVLRSVME